MVKKRLEEKVTHISVVVCDGGQHGSSSCGHCNYTLREDERSKCPKCHYILKEIKDETPSGGREYY